MNEDIIWNHTMLKDIIKFSELGEAGNYHSVDFKDKRVLDVGCSDGIHSFNAEKKGAKEVISIDIFDGQYGQHTKGALQNEDKDWKFWSMGYLKAHQRLNSKCKYIFPYSVYDVNKEKFGEFDVVLLLGVLYHLVHPALALEKVNEVLKMGGIVVIDCETSPLGTFYCGNNTIYNGDKTCFTIMALQDLKELLKFAGFQEIEMYHKARNRIGLIVQKVGVPDQKYSSKSIYTTMDKIKNF